MSIPLIGTRTVVALVSVLFFVAAEASARNTEHLYSVQEAVDGATGREKVLDVRFYFAGQSHSTVKNAIGEWTARRSSRGVFRSDKRSCEVAFLSALIALQERAKEEGGDAIVDIKSATRGKETSDPDKYRCVAGATVVHVALTGTVVRLE